jgi:peptide subunit release factor RF-3
MDMQVVSRLKKSKKKNTSLTQEMLNEFNKSHMGGMGPVAGGGGMDNFGVADDLYNMDDVWNDKQLDRTFDRRPPKASHSFSLCIF